MSEAAIVEVEAATAVAGTKLFASIEAGHPKQLG